MSHKKVKKSKHKSPLGPTRREQTSPPDRRAGRIPGVDVGKVVDTSLGPKKKVCFNIGGRWYFRMVIFGWKPSEGSKKGCSYRQLLI